MQILFLESDPTLREIYLFAFECELDGSVSIAMNFDQAIKFLTGEFGIDKWDLIVANEHWDKGSIVHLLSALEKESVAIPVVLYKDLKNEELSITKEEIEYSHSIEYLEDPIDIDETLNIISKNFATTDQTENSVSKEIEYNRVKLSLFLDHSQVNCDVFLKISDDHFHKIITGGEVYDHEELLKHELRNVKHLYLKSSDYVGFIQLVVAEIFKFFDSKKEYQPLENTPFILKVHYVVYELINKLGFEKNIIFLTGIAVNEILKNIEKSYNLQDLLDSVPRTGDYVCEHSLLLSYICVHMLKLSPWNTLEKHQQIVMAALLHDLSITKTELAEILDLDESALSEMNDIDKQFLKNHPKRSAKFLSNSTISAVEVEKLILQHHERPDGSGYPYGLTLEQIDPISAIFIVAEEFLRELYRVNFEIDDQDLFIFNLKRKFQKGHFAKAVQFLEFAMEGSDD